MDEKYLIVLTTSRAVAKALEEHFSLSHDKHFKCASFLTREENHLAIPQIYWNKGYYKVIVIFDSGSRREQLELWVA